jgi:stage V sporulation protein S
MNRFFSKLDLRDIKINPTGNSFPPDDVIVEEAMEAAEAAIEAQATPDVVAEPEAEALPLQDEVTAEGRDEASPGDVLKVSARSRPSAVAGAIAGVVREMGRAEVQAIGAGATNQAVKAVAIAREYLRETGIEAVCLPAFIDVTIDDEDRTAILLVIEPR